MPFSWAASGRPSAAIAAPWPTSRPDDLAALVVGAALERAGVPLDAVDEVIFGAANQAGEDNRNVARMAVLLAGLPRRGPRLHRQPAVRQRACRPSRRRRSRSAAGEADVVVAGGVESMTRAPMVMAKSPRPWARRRRGGRHHARLAAGQPALQGPRRRQGDDQPRRDRRGGRGPRRHHPRGLRRLGPALAAAHGRAPDRLAPTSWPSRPPRASVGRRTRCRGADTTPRRWPSSSRRSRPTAS